MKNKIIFFFLLLALLSTLSYAQAQQVEYDSIERANAKDKQQEDTTSLLYAFKNARVNGYFRSFTMVTDNASGLTDYYANAIGGNMKFETLPFKNIQWGISGFFVFNVGSSDLTKPDVKTKQMSRYETSLFDVEDPANKNDINGIDELYFKYSFKNVHVILGRQLINTPFINTQDGRMKPTKVQGIWADFSGIKNTKIEGGFLYKISPRGTVQWYKTGESIGVYPAGLNADGSKAEYAGNLQSAGIALLGISHQLNRNFKWQLWEQFVENIFNTTMVQLDYSHQLAAGSTVLGALQAVRQDAVNSGGNKDPSKTYFTKGSNSLSYGAKFGWKNKNLETSLNYNRITKNGRFQMPREWGIEPFFTFLPRERNEGLGDVDAAVAKVNYRFSKAGLKTSLAFGFYHLPEVNNYALNKYLMPSYNQLNVDAHYQFEGDLKGLAVQFLYVYKSKTGATFNNISVINKVNVSLFNLILNYNF